MNANLPMNYPRLLEDIKERICAAQVKANLAANRELILLYLEIDRLITSRQQKEGWGTGVIPRLARDLKNELPDIKGFSERNIKRMTRFYREYPNLLHDVPQIAAQLKVVKNKEAIKVPQPAALLAEVVWNIPWFHHVILFEKIKDMSTRVWYMQQTVENGWSRNILDLQIKNNAYERVGKGRRGYLNL